MPRLSFRLTHCAIWEGKDRPSTDKMKKKESPCKQLPICSTTKPVSSTHALTILMLTRYAIWEGKDRPSIDKWEKKKVHASNCLYAQPPRLYAQLMPRLSFRLTHCAIWEGKDRPSTDKMKKKRKSMQAIAHMLNHQACKLNSCLDYPYAHPLCHLGGEGSTLHR